MLFVLQVQSLRHCQLRSSIPEYTYCLSGPQSMHPNYLLFIVHYVWFLRATAGTAIARLSHRNSVRPSVCPSHGWISQKRCKL